MEPKTTIPHLYLVKDPSAPKPSKVVRLPIPADCSPFAVLYACGGALRAYDPAALDT